MVILKALPFRDSLDLATMIEYDTKKVIQEHAKLINVSLPSSYRKGEMAQGLATCRNAKKRREASDDAEGASGGNVRGY